MTPAQVLRSARKSLGVPFVHGGRSVRGLDCVGLFASIAHDLGYPFEDNPGYSPTHSTLLLEAMRKFTDELPLDARRPGDFGLYWMDPVTRTPWHCAVFTEQMWLIHGYDYVGKIVENPPGRFFEKRLAHVFRLRGMEAA